jgi:phenylpropionate dioxygenase-like ring-hydroxylating dioxygenase large terminal subunit
MLDVSAVGDLAELRETLADGRALPSHWYTDPDVYKIELTKVLRRSWHYAAHTGQLAEVGDQLPLEIAGIPVVLVRGTDLAVKGYINVCRHRAHVVVLEARNRKAMTCAYHGWSYSLDGSLKHAPRSEFEADFDASECSMKPVQVAVWGPTIWVNPQIDAPSFDEWIAGLKQQVADNGIDIDRHSFAFGRDWQINANWKVFVDNAIECYHCPVAHPSLSRIIDTDPTQQTLVVGGTNWSSHRTPLRRTEANPNGDRVYFFHWIWPTTYFQYAGGGFDIGSIGLVDVDHFVFRSQFFVPDDLDPAELQTRRQRLDDDPTVPEDIAICERVQHAHASGAAEPGRLLVGSELLVQHFQQVLVDTIAR